MFLELLDRALFRQGSIRQESKIELLLMHALVDHEVCSVRLLLWLTYQINFIFY